MPKSKAGFRIYTVVDVMSGVAVGVEHFLKPSDAKRCLKRLCRSRDLNEDDVQLFEAFVRRSCNAATR